MRPRAHSEDNSTQDAPHLTGTEPTTTTTEGRRNDVTAGDHGHGGGVVGASPDAGGAGGGDRFHAGQDQGAHGRLGRGQPDGGRVQGDVEKRFKRAPGRRCTQEGYVRGGGEVHEDGHGQALHGTIKARPASTQSGLYHHGDFAAGKVSLTRGGKVIIPQPPRKGEDKMDANMKKLLDTLNDLRGIRWKILSQAQGLDRDLTVVAEMITAVIISLHENYGQTWLEFDAEGKRAREGSMHFPMVLLESRQFEIEPKPVT